MPSIIAPPVFRRLIGSVAQQQAPVRVRPSHASAARTRHRGLPATAWRPPSPRLRQLAGEMAPFRRPQSAGRRRGHARTGNRPRHPCRVHIERPPLESQDTLAERLRRRPAKPMGSPRVGSNPTGVACPGGPAQHSRHMLDRAGRAPPSRHCRDWRRQAFLPSAPAALRTTATAAALARASCQKIGCGWAPLGGAASDKRKFATLPTSRDSSAGRASD